MLRLLFLWRIILLPVCSIYKRVLIARYAFHVFDKGRSHQGPLWAALQTAIRYGLQEHVQLAIETAEPMSLQAWKKLVTNLIHEKEIKSWQIHSKLFKSLSHVRLSMPKVAMLSWWYYVHDNPIDIHKCHNIARLFLNCHKLNTCLHKHGNSPVPSPLCTLCNEYKMETVEHMLFECTGLQSERWSLWQNVLKSAPTPVIKDYLISSDNLTKCIFLLSGLMNSYISEWFTFYKETAAFLSGMYLFRLHQPTLDH